MRHRLKLNRYKGGRDASRMMTKKLMINFLKSSSLVTTEKKAKTIKSQLEKIITLTRSETESHKNQLLHFFPDQSVIKVLFEQVGVSFSKINGGYLKLSRMTKRDSDATQMMKLEWAHPVAITWGVKKETVPVKKKKKTVEQKEVK